MRGADALARILKLEGVEVLFSYPNHPLIDAAAQLGIRPIIARGEKTILNVDCFPGPIVRGSEIPAIVTPAAVVLACVTVRFDPPPFDIVTD